MFLKLFSLGVPVRLNSENSLFEKAAVPFKPVLLNLLHIYTDTHRHDLGGGTQNILVILFQKICSISWKLEEK